MQQTLVISHIIKIIPLKTYVDFNKVLVVTVDTTLNLFPHFSLRTYSLIIYQTLNYTYKSSLLEHREGSCFTKARLIMKSSRECGVY